MGPIISVEAFVYLNNCVSIRGSIKIMHWWSSNQKLNLKFRLIKLIIVLQKWFDPIVANCFHFAFRHYFPAVTCKPQRMEVDGEEKTAKLGNILKIKSLFYLKRTLPTAQVGNKNNLENPEFHSSQVLNDRRLPRSKVKLILVQFIWKRFFL